MANRSKGTLKSRSEDSGKSKLVYLPQLDIYVRHDRKLRCVCPSEFTFTDIKPRRNSIKFLAEMWQRFQKAPSLILLDLGDLEQITAGPALVLFSIVSSMRIMSGFPSLVEIKLPANRDIRRLIVRSNLLSALKVGSAQRLDSLMEKGSSFASGSDASEHYPKLCGSLTERFGKSHPLLYRAINEVLLNVRHHAYDSSALQRLAQTIGNRFWHYSYATNDRVYFAVYDIGQGIPEGLRNLQNQFEPDEVLVEDAMKPGFSRTLMSGRGNGSVAMKRPVAEATANLAAFNQDDSGSVFGGLPVMHMVIVSGRAYYRLDAGHTPTATSDAKAELVGTFIEWTLPLAGEYE